MTSDRKERRLQIYLSDHLALMLGEAELADRCRRSNEGAELASFLEQLKIEVQAQRTIVKDVLQRLGGRASLLKDGGAWLAEKLGRLKLNDGLVVYSDLSRVLELEGLALSAQARAMMWSSLDTQGSQDVRLEGITFSFFQQQSQEHFEELSRRHQQAAELAF